MTASNRKMGSERHALHQQLEACSNLVELYNSAQPARPPSRPDEFRIIIGTSSTPQAARSFDMQQVLTAHNAQLQQ